MFQLGPPVVSLYQIDSAADTWVSVCWWVVVVVYDGSFLLVISGYYILPLLLPSSCYVLELVGVDPGTDDVFILFLVFSCYLDEDCIG